LVDASDEALVLQIVQHFFPRWNDELNNAALGVTGLEDEQVDAWEDDGSTSTGRPSLLARGAQRGQVKTLSKTRADFMSWHSKVLLARASPYCEEWDEWLRTRALVLETSQEKAMENAVVCGDQSAVEGQPRQNTMFDMMLNSMESYPVEEV
jgi:hypothetical protein